MIKKIKIPKFILIVFCLLTSVISINKLDALTYRSYLWLNGSSTDLSVGDQRENTAGKTTIYNSGYYLEDTGGLDYYVITRLKFCSTAQASVSNAEDIFLVSSNVKRGNLGSCKVNNYDAYSYEITWTRYLPVVNGSNTATAQVFVKFDANFYYFVKFLEKTITVQTAQVYEQQQTNDKQDQTNDKLDDLNNNLKNSDVDTNGSFFSNFTSTDHGISGIITAPLRAINKLTSACQPVTFSVLEEPIELPCGDTLFWNKEGVQSFRLIWNILVGGPILFALLKKLFKVVESLKNPDDDRIEVMDL